MFSEAKPKETLRFRKQNSLFPVELVFKFFVVPSNTKPEKNCQEIIRFTPADSQICAVKEHGLITCESKFMLLFR